MKKTSKNKKLFIHLILIFFTGIFLVWLTLKILDIYTARGKHYTVGNYKGLTYEEIISNPSNNIFVFKLIDSVYDNTKIKNTVVNQIPSPGGIVKKGRMIYLTIVSTQPEMVESPNLEDLTLRQAITVLKTYGLQVGNIEYVPDIGSSVISWKQYGKIIKPKQKIPKGSKVDLVVGKEAEEEEYIPNLIGLSREEALFQIKSAGFNVGAENLPLKKDTLSLIVKKQRPEFVEGEKLKLGSLIDLWYE